MPVPGWEMHEVRTLPLLVILAGAPVFAQTTVEIASKGRAMLPIVIPPGASPRVKQSAGDLATYLGRITGSQFEIETGTGQDGVAVGTLQQFPELAAEAAVGRQRAYGREDYWIRSRSGGVSILGATDEGVEHAVWDFLYRLGYRQYFPGPKWEVVPHILDLKLSLDVRESPAYRSRKIWYGHGPWDYAAEPYRQWTVRNRMAGGVNLQTGHAYAGIIRALQKEFDQHPEYYALVNGERRIHRQAKFCIGNENLRRLVVQYELERFRKDPGLESVSLEPSDGGGWCECPLCKALGSVSNRVVLLANEVAAAVTAEFPGKTVGIYAYGAHAAAPTIRVHPNVVVSVATAFLKGGVSAQDLMQGWASQGAVLGVREYYSVNTWDRDQPGHARGGNLHYLASTIPQFHGLGARFLSAEASDNWAPNGLGYYVASRVMWDLGEAGRVGALVDDFLQGAFGSAKEPMREFYGLLDGSRPPMPADEQLGRMFRALASARASAVGNPAVKGRLDDLVLYAWYCSLYHRYATAGGDYRQEAFEALVRHTYRMRATMMVHAKALFKDLPRRDRTVTLPAGAAWTVPEGKNPWKSSTPFSDAEIATFIRDGQRLHVPTGADLPRATFSGRLEPAVALNLPSTVEGGSLDAVRGDQTYLVFIANERRTLEVVITTSLVQQDRSNVSVRLWKVPDEGLGGGPEVLTEEDSVPSDGQRHIVHLAIKGRGLYRVVVSDEAGRSSIEFEAGLACVFPSTEDRGMNPGHSLWMAYFYVPKGTRTVSLLGGTHGEVQDSRGRTVFWLNGRERKVYGVSVPDGEDGHAWRLRYGEGDVRLLNVPPYFARTPAQLVLPEEIVRRDGDPSPLLPN